MYLHTNLKKLRELKGQTQAVIADALGVKRSSYSGYENGGVEPDASMLLTMSDYFRIPVDTLLREDLANKPNSVIELLQRKFHLLVQQI